jgi:hypothetical protein
LQSVLSAVLRDQEQWNAAVLREQEQRNATALREQEQRFTQLLETLRLGNGAANNETQAAIKSTEQRNSPPPQLPDIEAYVADIENPTHFEDWLKSFEMSLLCAAPNIQDNEKTMVLATKL